MYTLGSDFDFNDGFCDFFSGEKRIVRIGARIIEKKGTIKLLKRMETESSNFINQFL